MSIDLKHFVDVNIKRHSLSKVASSRDTVVLLSRVAEEEEPADDIEVTSTDYTIKLQGKALEYAEIFFAENGKKLLVKFIAYDATNANIVAIIKNLPDEYICITALDNSVSLNDLATISDDLDKSGIHEKVIIGRSTSIPSTPDTYKNKHNLIVKYSNVDGAQMTVAAYLSKIDVSNGNTFTDYMFTEEHIDAEDISDDNYKALIAANYNVNIELANSSRNCGGNCTNGDDLVNMYIRIILQQSLTASLLNLLTQKIKDSSAISKIYTTCVNELEKYRNSGYLTTDKIWVDNDLTQEYNNKIYTIIEKGEALTSGYKVVVVPYIDLSETDRATHKAPPVYVVIADTYSIRSILVTGEVF